MTSQGATSTYTGMLTKTMVLDAKATKGISSGVNDLTYLLGSYFGLDKHEIAKIKTLPSRWVTIVKCYPAVIFTQNEVYLR